MVPIKYNLRNLRVRWVTTLMIVLATGLVVFATVLTFGLTDGLEYALRIGGEPLDLIVLRKGANDETSSSITESQATEIANLSGVAKDANGNPLCSAEYVTILTKPRRGQAGTTNLIVRGLEQVGRVVRPGFNIVEGRDLKAGLNELITSRRLAERFENLAIGEKLEINRVEFSVVGYFEASGSSAESEVWGDIRDITGARRQQGAVSSVTLRAADATSKQNLSNRIRDDEQFKLNPIDELKFFEDQMSASLVIKIIGSLVSGFLTLGAMFAAANTMFSAVSSRSREIGTMRALGFGQSSILFSFLMESLVLCLLGGVLGCLATLPLNGLRTGTANWATFSELTFSFRFGPAVLIRAVVMTLAMGLLGGLFPALRAMRLRITDALRAQ